jgi:hypothetical protein
MLEIGVITSDSADNKLYYQVNQRYEYYVPLRAIFADEKIVASPVAQLGEVPTWQKTLTELPGVRVAVAAGVLVHGSSSSVDLLLVGDMPKRHTSELIKSIEAEIRRELTYTTLSYDEFYYRLSVHDRFISGIIRNKHQVLVDTDSILK